MDTRLLILSCDMWFLLSSKFLTTPFCYYDWDNLQVLSIEPEIKTFRLLTLGAWRKAICAVVLV
jgi:hypothetical protein